MFHIFLSEPERWPTEFDIENVQIDSDKLELHSGLITNEDHNHLHMSIILNTSVSQSVNTLQSVIHNNRFVSSMQSIRMV